MAKEYLSIPEAAAVLGISRIAAFKQVKKGRLPAIRIGRNWAVPAGAVVKKQAGGDALGRAAAARVVPPAGASGPDVKYSGGDRDFEDMGWD